MWIPYPRQQGACRSTRDTVRLLPSSRQPSAPCHQKRLRSGKSARASLYAEGLIGLRQSLRLCGRASMKKSQLAELLELRIIVGYLGERNHFGWWPSLFYDQSGKMFLAPVFPKTYRLSQYHGVVEAARRVHDEHIGVGNAFHLFRVAEEVEQDLHKLILADDGVVSENPVGREAALERLSALAGGETDATEGPVAIGKYETLLTSGPLKAAAQCYLAAFKADVRSYPYFMG